MDMGHASAHPLPVRKDQPDEQRFFAAIWSTPRSPVGIWPHSAVISPNNFVYKSLSNWSFNIAVGCSHGCTFCYVPEVSTIKLAKYLAAYGVTDPDEEWGRYVLLRSWDEPKFLASLRAAKLTPREQLNPDGNRAVIYCGTPDPYQVFRHPDQDKRQHLTDSHRYRVRS